MALEAGKLGYFQPLCRGGVGQLFFYTIIIVITIFTDIFLQFL